MVEKKSLMSEKLSYIKMKLLLGQPVATLYPLLCFLHVAAHEERASVPL